MVISRHRIVDWKLYSSGTTTEIMNEFVSNLNCKGTIIMDNLRSHHSKIVKNTLHQKGLKALFTLPYSPELNPIEEVFSLFKRAVRNNFVTSLEQLKKIITETIFKINTTIDLNKFYHHAFN